MADLIQEQATTYTPGENDLVYNTVVTMGSYSSPQPVVIKQYDSLPIIAAKMRKDGNDYQVPDGAAVNIRLHKRSGTFIYSSVKGISQDRKTAYIQLTSNMTAVYGRTMPCLEIVVNGSVACTGDMVWDIQRNPVQEDDVKDTSEGQYIQEMAAQVQAFEDKYQEALDYMNNAANQSRINNAASNAQTAQQAATNAANSADEAEEEANRAATESAKALGFRSFHGGQVVPGATDGDLDPSRPMSTPTAASATIKARGDRIAGLTMAGKTTQAGTGDPSPNNIRMIDGVGMYDKCVVLDGSEEGWRISSGDSTSGHTYTVLDLDVDGSVISGLTVSSKASWSRNVHADWALLPPDGKAHFIRNNGIKTTFCTRYDSGISALKSYLSSHPLIIWYRSIDFYKSKGPFYTVVELSNEPYRAVGFELNAPLFDGDTLQVGVPSGCDKQIKLDGSAVQVVASDGDYAVSADDAAGPAYASGLAGLTVSDGVIIIPDSSFPASVTDASTANSWLQDNPQTVFYRSTSYSQENDIAVALEKRVNGYAAFDGKEGIKEGAANTYQITSAKIDDALAKPSDSSDISSHYRFANNGAPVNLPMDHFTWGMGGSKVFIMKQELTEKMSSFLSSQYSAGTPIQVVYELATPVSYARSVPTMIAQPGEDGTFTVTGENSLSVLLKPFQDGGDAARLNGHTWDDIMAAIDQKIASLASTVMEVN